MNEILQSLFNLSKLRMLLKDKSLAQIRTTCTLVQCYTFRFFNSSTRLLEIYKRKYHGHNK